MPEHPLAVPRPQVNPALTMRSCVWKVTYSVRRGPKRGTGELLTRMEVEHVAREHDGKQGVACPINLTNHAYWNLSGDRKRGVEEHELVLQCDRFLPLDDNQVCDIPLICDFAVDSVRSFALVNVKSRLTGLRNASRSTMATVSVNWSMVESRGHNQENMRTSCKCVSIQR